MPRNNDAIQAAQRFIAIHHGEYLSADHERLVCRCAEHLVETCEISLATAMTIAAQANADRACIGTRAYVDVDRCTSTSVIVKDTATGSSYMLSVAELLTLIHPDISPAAAG